MVRRLALVLGLILACSNLSWAQATATLNGRVVDQDGAVLPGATVTVDDPATGTSRNTVTNGEGLWTVPALNPGNYTVKVEMPGFSPQVRANIDLRTAATLTVDVKLGLANVQETLTVTGQAPQVETTQSVLAN